MTFICRPASADIWYIQSIKKKTSEKNFDVNTRVPRRARWDFRCVLDDSLFLYLEFDLNKYLKNWLNYEVLRMKLGDLLLLLLLFIYWRFMGSCTTLQWFYTQICFFPVLTVSYIHQPVCFDVILCIYTYSTSLLCAAFIIFSGVLSYVCYSACFNTITLYALFSLLFLLTDGRSSGLLLTHSLAGGTLPTPYHRSFNNLFITIFFIYYSFCTFVLF